MDLNDAGGAAERLVTFTVAGATKPVVGDWDGDGDDNVGVVKAGTYPNPDTWYLDTDGAGGAAERTLLSPPSLSNLGDLPVSGRWQWLTSHTRDTYVYDGPHILLTFRDPNAGGPEPATPRAILIPADWKAKRLSLVGSDVAYRRMANLRRCEANLRRALPYHRIGSDRRGRRSLQKWV